jgi:pimeloyl-ACP methyl ester carboxylesterase
MKSQAVVVGSGPPLVLIPGIQGRWEWMRRAVVELARQFRVVTLSLPDDLQEEARDGCQAFDRHLEQVERALDQAGANRAIVCGVSYGGLVAIRFAALHGDRLLALVLASAPGPHWQPDERARRYARRPLRSVPAFVLGAHSRLWHEVSASPDGRLAAWSALGGYLWDIARHPPSPASMAGRVRLLAPCDFAADARRITAPTLVLTGEPDLDRVVPVAGTREYLTLIPGAVGRTLEGTGHVGLVTRPREFARAIREFVTHSTTIEGTL